MCSILAVIPSSNADESFLFGTVAEGFPFVLRYGRDPSNGVDLFLSGESSCVGETDVQSIFNAEFGKRETDTVSRSEVSTSRPSSKPKRLIDTLNAADAIGWDRVKYLSADGRVIEFMVTDSGNRCHVLRFRASDDNATVKCEVALPGSFATEVETADMVTVYENFANAIEDYQLFWDDMNELDRSVPLIESTQPKFSDQHRSIYLESQVSLRVSVNPLAPRALPKLTFLGPEPKVRTYQNLVDSGLATWDDDRSLLQNLLSLFGKFKSSSELTQQSVERQWPATSDVVDAENEEVKCDICYGTEDPPRESCRRCQRVYHRACLYECLKRQPSKVRTFNAVACKCPHCGQVIHTVLR